MAAVNQAAPDRGSVIHVDFRGARQLDDAEQVQREIEELEERGRAARLSLWILASLGIAGGLGLPLVAWILA